MTKRNLSIGLAAAAVVFLGWALVRGGVRGLVTNEARATACWRAPRADVEAALRDVADRLERWRLVVGREGRFRFEIETAVFGFVDDMTVDVGEREGRVCLSIRSKSRVGKGDFGENARNVRRLLDHLAEGLGEAPEIED